LQSYCDGRPILGSKAYTGKINIFPFLIIVYKTVLMLQICERHLSMMINLKNVGDILQFSDNFNASQLKNSCLQFVAQNLAPILEAKGLENVTWSCLKDAAKYYR
jgi:hypothetical protein